MSTPVWFPDVQIQWPTQRRFRNLPVKMEHEFIRLDIVSKLLKEQFEGAGASVGTKFAELPDRIFVNCT